MAKTNLFIDVRYERTLLVLPAVIICILGVISNVLLLVVFIKDPLKCFRNSGTYLVMNLSVSDCLTCLTASFYLTGPIVDFPIFDFLMFWFPYVSYASIISVSTDRLLLVAFPIKHRILMRGKILIACIAAVWIVGCVIPTSRLFSNRETLRIYTFGYPTLCVIVIILSSVMYSSTYHKLKKQSRNMALQNSTEGRAQEIRILKEKRFLKTIIIIASIALFSVVPSLAFSLVYNALGLNTSASKVVGAISIFILSLNFALNSLVYIVRLPSYRKTFRLLYCGGRRASS